ncbi:hypothetical protein DERP_008471 [Dermatophagoides pteronyssinus]|uniref:Uncharacterized protein n=1 Tax=Dermatophagoides pteronyssinus TaxID=6956 RepID=A0ABQ8IVD2_DERPT|nr:hypothetical protein DERP_008471 [Dermatophagoides pteronyssinus]
MICSISLSDVFGSISNSSIDSPFDFWMIKRIIKRLFGFNGSIANSSTGSSSPVSINFSTGSGSEILVAVVVGGSSIDFFFDSILTLLVRGMKDEKDE